MIPGPFNLDLYKGSTFGPVTLTAYTDETRTTVVNLTGYQAHAKVRETDTGPVIIDLLPTITNGPGGVVTIPAIADELTPGFPRGNYVWDLLLENPSGKVLGPFLAGTFTIHTARSRP